MKRDVSGAPPRDASAGSGAVAARLLAQQANASGDAQQANASGDGQPALDGGSPRRKFGLVVQGGSMRGVFTAGALCGLEALGLRDTFDVVYGSSGGAINAAYFLAGQVPFGTSIYYCDINNSSFVSFDPRRVLRGTALDIDYCFDEVVAERKRLDLGRVLAHPTLFKVYVTDPAISRPHAFLQHGIESESELLAALKASSAMPFVFRRPVTIRGRRYVDGAFLEPVPVLEAIADGCTDILALLSRPMTSHPVNIKPWARYLIHRHIRPENMAASESAWQAGQRRLEETLELLREEVVVERQVQVNLAYIAPPHEFPVHRWTTSQRTLIDAAIDGAARVMRLFGMDDREVMEAATRAVHAESFTNTT